MKKVLVRGPALSQAGYGEHTRFLLRSLRTREDLFDIYLINVGWGATSWLWDQNEEREWIDSILEKTAHYLSEQGQFDVSLQVTIPGEWEKLAPINIGVTAGTETTKISPQWVEKCLHMDKIIVVSEHTRQSIINTSYPAVNNATGENFEAKTTCPVDVVGYPCKDIKKSKIKIDLEHDFNFLTVGTWIPRKNMESTIRWFMEEFQDEEVGLIIKTSVGKNSILDRKHCFNRLKSITETYKDAKCNVYLLHGDLLEEEMTYLYNHPKVKALISMSHGEGFGLPMFEAAYNGLPVIATDWGGQCDFLYMPDKNKKKKAMFTKIPYELKMIQPEAVWDAVLIKDSQWAFPVEWSTKKAFRQFRKNHEAAVSRAKKLKTWIKKEFSEKKQFEKFANSVADVLDFENDEWLSELEDMVKEYE